MTYLTHKHCKKNLKFNQHCSKQNKDIYILLNNKESLIVDYFYRNSNSSLEQMSEDLQVPVTTITQTISKHLKIQQNESRNNKSNDSKS